MYTIMYIFTTEKIETVLIENTFAKEYILVLRLKKINKLHMQVPCCSSSINSENDKE